MPLSFLRTCDDHVGFGRPGNAGPRPSTPPTIAAVVASDVVVQVLPDTFDPIVVGAARRQKVQLQFPRRLRLHRQLHLQAVVDPVIVEDDMNPFGARVSLRGQLVEQVQEKQAVLPLTGNVNESTCLGIPRAGKIALLIASMS